MNHTRKLTLRIRPEDFDKLEALGFARSTPPAVLGRQVLVEWLGKQRPPQGVPQREGQSDAG